MSDIATMSTGDNTPRKPRRRFLYNGTLLSDPDPTMTVQEVKDYYTRQFPELNNATVAIDENGLSDSGTGRKETWQFRGAAPAKPGNTGLAVVQEKTIEFKKSVGTKG